MLEIIKTWPAFMDARTVARIFSPTDYPFHSYFFTLGRGKPRQPITRLWFTYRGRILGSFKIDDVVVNDGSLPRLRRLDGGDSTWQIKPDHWVAVCHPGCERLKERLFYCGFRGYRYFNIDSYRSTPESKVRL